MKIHIDIPDSLIAKYFGNAGHGAKSRAYDLIYEGLTEAFHTEIINIQYSQSMTNDEKRAAINQVTKDRDFLKEVQLAHISVDF